MPQIDELFRLVKSLEPNEKRYFKLHANKHVVSGKYKGNAEKLFDALNHWPEETYDEKLFKQKNKGKAFIKNLAFEKNYLYGKIMEVLRSYHAENTAEGKLNNILSDICLLYNKGLHDAALKMLEKGFELAERTENLPAMLLLFQFRYWLTRSDQSEKDIALNQKYFEKERLTIKRLEVERTLVHEYSNVYHLFSNGKLKAELNDIKARVAVYSLPDLSFYGRYYLFNINAYIAKTEERYRDAMKFYEEIFELWEHQSTAINESSTYKRISFGNYLISACYLEQFDVFPDIIRKIECLTAESPTDEAEAFHIAERYRLIYFLNTSQNINFSGTIKSIEDGLQKYGALISDKIKIALYINICLLCLKRGEFNRLIDFVNKSYNLIGRDTTWHYEMRDLKFFEIMARLSLKNYETLDYLLRNHDRWLKDNHLNNQLTSLMLTIFRELMYDKECKKLMQLHTTECLPDTLMLKELTVMWLNQRKISEVIT